MHVIERLWTAVVSGVVVESCARSIRRLYSPFVFAVCLELVEKKRREGKIKRISPVVWFEKEVKGK